MRPEFRLEDIVQSYKPDFEPIEKSFAKGLFLLLNQLGPNGLKFLHSLHMSLLLVCR
jgi:hypothetical protein